MEGIAADYELLIDLRSFQITGAPTAHVEFAAKILLGRTHRRIAFLRRGPAKHVSAAGGGRPASCEVRAGMPWRSANTGVASSRGLARQFRSMFVFTVVSLHAAYALYLRYFI